MTREETLRFRDQLVAWFRIHQRRLPWRQTKDPYAIWVSEVMLQQTQVKTVLPFYQRFMQKFPDIQHLARADLQEVLKVWERMGYYGRARNLHKAARIVVEEMDGKIPEDYLQFRLLPGVGDYIGAAVFSLAFDKPHPVLDGNVKRVISRLFLIESPMTTSSSTRYLKERASQLLDRSRPGVFNQAMMELGATTCQPRKPICSECPVSLFCQSCQTGRQHEIPVTMSAKAVPTYHLATGVVYRDNHLLITRRNTRGLLGGLWEFPGGKVKKGETAEQACLRELREEVNLSVEILGRITQVKHAYTHFRIVMDVFRCRYGSGEVVLRGPVDYRWITTEEIDQFPFPGANHKFIPLLLNQGTNE
ncbi:MAG: A/G-specific adenine glycosylase [Proteobacteria bacterium]|nr:A/G-specific adenine glycosylase [Pseudomonadota bacterium]NIS69079.1 A/G-specific adenine glycosylase [Pseudomonadota bacterium]